MVSYGEENDSNRSVLYNQFNACDFGSGQKSDGKFDAFKKIANSFFLVLFYPGDLCCSVVV